MNQEEYISDRLQDQIEWYDKKSLVNQKKFKRLRKTEIIVAAIIPLLAGLAVNYKHFNFIWLLIIGLMGVIVTIVASLISLEKYQENWIEYRTICESLKKEKILFITQAYPYQKGDAFHLLVERVETIISKENTNWSNYSTKREKSNQT